MGAFEYTALTSRGKNVRGVLHGDSARQIRQLLRNQELIPIEVSETRKALGQDHQSITLRRLRTQDLILFTRQLATMVLAGEPLDIALESIGKEFRRGFVRKIILSIRSSVLEGMDLASALQQYDRHFPDFYIATISAGEHSGKLGTILEHLADYIEYRHQHSQRLMLSLMYPAIVTAVALLVVVALMTYVVPQVIHVYEEIDQQLPLLTILLIDTSDFLQQNLLALTTGLMLTFLTLAYLYRITAARHQAHRLLLMTPILGSMLRNIQIARFSRTLSILLVSGVEIVEAMKIAARVVNLIPVNQRIDQAAKKVREGASIRKSLGDTHDFPAITLQLIASGENSGRLDNMLERAATSQEREIEQKLAILLGLFEPLLILTMGGLVLVIVLAVLLPIFDLNQMIKI